MLFPRHVELGGGGERGFWRFLPGFLAGSQRGSVAGPDARPEEWGWKLHPDKFGHNEQFDKGDDCCSEQVGVTTQPISTFLAPLHMPHTLMGHKGCFKPCLNLFYVGRGVPKCILPSQCRLTVVFQIVWVGMIIWVAPMQFTSMWVAPISAQLSSCPSLHRWCVKPGMNTYPPTPWWWWWWWLWWWGYWLGKDSKTRVIEQFH